MTYYKAFQEDVKLLVDMGVDSYRFSISWTRIFPQGRGMINEKGITYYNNLIDDLLKNGIKPFVTIFHWDLPQPFQDEYGGFLSDKIVPDFTAYANTCFERFGDRVKNWVTINELFSISVNGYDNGIHAPGRCSNTVGNCSAGNSATEPYIKKQKGSIGISLITHWFVPYTLSLNDQKATRRILDFFFGWFMDPLVYGEYPATMRALVGPRLPRFTKKQSRLVKGSYDYIGVNYYTAMYALKDNSTPIPNPMHRSFMADSRVNLTYSKNGVLIGPQGGSDWLHVYPRGIRALLNYIKTHYNNLPVYITENGTNEVNNASMPLKESLNDTWRVNHVSQHLLNVLLAVRDGCNVQGYFGWTFMDDFEWDVGYSVRYGFYFVDRTHNVTRYPKASALWLKRFLHN